MGPPGRLRLTLAQDLGGGAALAAVHLPESLQPYLRGQHPALRRAGEPARTRLRLPPDTPPGHYEARLAFADGREAAVDLVIEPRPRLRVTPGTLHLAGAAGEQVQARLLLENRGNVSLPIEDALVTGVFDNNGIETALAAAYRLPGDDLNQVLATLFGRLRDAHGGLLKLRVTEGAGPLDAGEQRWLTLETTLGTKLHAGHGYHGVVSIGPHALAVRLQVTDSPSTAPHGGTR